ncbi:hypothetical protein [Aquimarina litoralis]|uniref:hypothetical protein n=1 Tax=Aquimarina litoralis TaxID=584605 RepID=UPI001C562591|nr:hypothetical protein [Aquimarina litoralis]MBW1298717.1 hypothetical protein [Aquimarina litoralis]
MKLAFFKKIVLVLIIIQSIPCFADAGLAFRFKVAIQLEDGSTDKGYFYFYTYNDKFDPSKEKFIDYLKNDPHFGTLKLYKEIKSVYVENNFEIDFNIKSKTKILNHDQITHMTLLEEFEFPVGDKVFEVSEEVYEFLEYEPKQISYLEVSTFENCTLELISFNEGIDLIFFKEKIEKELGEIILKDKLNGEKINEYLKTVSIGLAKNKIILVNFCDAL